MKKCFIYLMISLTIVVFNACSGDDPIAPGTPDVEVPETPDSSDEPAESETPDVEVPETPDSSDEPIESETPDSQDNPVIIDGIYYCLHEDTNTAGVTGEGVPETAYTGDLVIPESFTYEGVTYSVTYIEGLTGFLELSSVSIPGTVTTLGYCAFKLCTNLKMVNLPNSLATIGDLAFDGCKSLTSVDIPNSVTSIGEAAFRGCYNLTVIKLPASVTSIASQTFKDCQNLRSVEIPSSVTEIGWAAFANCRYLEKVTCFSPTPPVCKESDYVFGHVPVSTCVLSVPAGAISAYSQADVWKDFIHIEENSITE